MKTIHQTNSVDIKGIYITPVNNIIGIPLFRQNGQEFRELLNTVELWQKNGDGRMHLRKTWRKKSIKYIEYTDLPNTWVEPRAL
jgi:hypothetical protein